MDILYNLFSKNELAQIEHERFDFSERLFTSWDEVRKRKIIIFGAGLFGSELAKVLLKENVHPLFFVDSNLTLCGSTINGIEVKPVTFLRNHSDAIAILPSAYAKEMAIVCKYYGIKTIIPVDLPATDMPIPPIGYRTNELSAELIYLYDILDDHSRFILRNFLKFQLTLNLKYIHEIYSPHPYFSGDLLEKVKYERFCDLGASTGDTFNEFISLTKNGMDGSYYYYAFEPDKKSFDELAKSTSSFPNVEAIYGAVGDHHGITKFLCNGVMSSAFWTSGAETTTVPLYTLDEYEFKNGIPTVIKADIEGFELNALEGAKNIISEYKPDLIFSIYHKVEDLYQIPLYINNLGLGYKIHIRQQSKTFGETLVYAIKDR